MNWGCEMREVPQRDSSHQNCWQTPEVIPSAFKTDRKMTVNQPCLSYGFHIILIFCLSICLPQNPATRHVLPSLPELSSLQRTLLIHPLIYSLQHLWDIGNVIPPPFLKEGKWSPPANTPQTDLGLKLKLFHSEFKSLLMPHAEDWDLAIDFSCSGHGLLQVVRKWLGIET